MGVFGFDFGPFSDGDPHLLNPVDGGQLPGPPAGEAFRKAAPLPSSLVVSTPLPPSNQFKPLTGEGGCTGCQTFRHF